MFPVTHLLCSCLFSVDGFPLLLRQLEQLILVTGRLESLASDIWFSSDEVVSWSDDVVRWTDAVVKWSDVVVWWSGQVVKAEILNLFLEG